MPNDHEIDHLPSPAEALAGRPEPMPLHEAHFILGTDLRALPEGHREAFFGMGCFWGAEKLFWGLDGVYSTAVGYQGGITLNPTYTEVCSGRTGHTEAVRVVYDPSRLSLSELLKIFWENHDPTQGDRQGNDIGTQYRSAVFVTAGELEDVLASRASYAPALADAGYGEITTEIAEAPEFFFAEDYHQQYLAKNPAGYCGIGGTGVACQIGLDVESS